MMETLLQSQSQPRSRRSADPTENVAVELAVSQLLSTSIAVQASAIDQIQDLVVMALSALMGLWLQNLLRSRKNAARMENVAVELAASRLLSISIAVQGSAIDRIQDLVVMALSVLMGLWLQNLLLSRRNAARMENVVVELAASQLSSSSIAVLGSAIDQIQDQAAMDLSVQTVLLHLLQHLYLELLQHLPRSQDAARMVSVVSGPPDFQLSIISHAVLESVIRLTEDPLDMDCFVQMALLLRSQLRRLQRRLASPPARGVLIQD